MKTNKRARNQNSTGPWDQHLAAGRHPKGEGLLKFSGCIKPPVRKGIDLSICTYNCRSLSRDEQIYHLLQEVDATSCDVLGVCETRRRADLNARWRDGNTVLLGKGDGPRRTGGIGFIVSRKWSSQIISCQFRSSRVGVLLLQLSSKRSLKIVQIYAPTITSDDEEVEEFYAELESTLCVKSTYTIVMGDFNAKLGRGKREGEKYIGTFGIGVRNSRGDRMAAMAEANKLFIGNTWFRKKANRRWTWIAPNAETKNEIDYILVDTRRILKDVSVVPSFNTGSDHRMLRARIRIITTVERRALYMSSQRKRPMEVDEVEMERQVHSLDWSMASNIEEDYQDFTEKLLHCARAAKDPRSREVDSRISESTNELLEKRKEMKRDKNRNVEYSLLCRLIRKKLKEDLENFKRQKELKAIQRKRSLKRCRREMLLYQQTAAALKNEKGHRVSERNGMEELCRHYYTNLFASRVDVQRPSMCATRKEPLPVLISEVRHAIFQMKNGKAPGSDGITIELLKAGGHDLWKALAVKSVTIWRRKPFPEVGRNLKPFCFTKTAKRSWQLPSNLLTHPYIQYDHESYQQSSHEIT